MMRVYVALQEIYIKLLKYVIENKNFIFNILSEENEIVLVR